MATTTQDHSHASDLICDVESRRHLTREAGWNGIDYLEVSEDQRRLDVYFFGRAPEGLREENVRIAGGRRERDIVVRDLTVVRSDDPRQDDCLQVAVDRPGDFSTYRLCLVETDERGRSTDHPLEGFDPRYACLDFTFKAGCPSDLDCAPVELCPPPVRTTPEIDYLARDYERLRQVIFDRLSLLVPDWRERHVPDIGVTLVELLAYVGDQLSYYQDAVATEAYLDTARKRVSVRRHARLVDYLVHDGCNARAWVCLAADERVELALDDIAVIAADVPASDAPMTWDEFQGVPESSRQAFEPLGSGTFVIRPAHNVIRIYTWDDAECCLSTGATSATLVDGWADDPEGPEQDKPDPSQQPPEHAADNADSKQRDESDGGGEEATDRERLLDLHVGDVIIFEEVIGPRTANPADADPTHRHAVCLTDVRPTVDPVTGQPVVEVAWADADALPFALCLSTREPAPECEALADVSVACGNAILVDHGLTVEEDLGEVPVRATDETCGAPCHPPEVVLTPGRFRPRLSGSPVTMGAPAAPCPARGALRQDPRLARPHLVLRQVLPVSGTTQVWTVVVDVLGSGPDDRHVVVEIDEAGRAELRFGDDESGRVPEPKSTFNATYRVGNGPAGNVGAGAIRRLVTKRERLDGVNIRVRNPLAAAGGTAPERVDEAKLLAPYAFRSVLARAITPADYAAIVERDFEQVQRASATPRFTGSHTEILVAVDQFGVTEAQPELLVGIARHLERYRRIGHDILVAPAVDVPLDLQAVVCVEPGYLRAPVENAVRQALSAQRNVDGTLGLFHPDRRSFGDGVYVSSIVATVQPLDGVESVVVRALHRLYDAPMGEIEAGVLRLGPLEIARLDNDLSMPEHGVLTLEMRGGR